MLRKQDMKYRFELKLLFNKCNCSMKIMVTMERQPGFECVYLHI